MGNSEPQKSRERIGRIEELVGRLDAIADDGTRIAAHELVRALLDLHGAGIERMLDIAYESGATGGRIIDDMGRDELVGSLLLLHGLHPLSLEARVLGALEKVRPQLGTHGGNVLLLGVTEEGRVRLRLEGNCHGCASSRVTLHYAIENAIYAAAPDVVAIDVEGAVDEAPVRPPGFVPESELMAETLAAVPDGSVWREEDCLELFKDMK